MAVLSLPNYADIFTNRVALTPQSTLVLYERVYMFVTATKGDFKKPVPIGSLDDFTNLFGSSDALTLNTIEAYLKNLRTGLYVYRVTPYPVGTVNIELVGAGDYGITIAAIPLVFHAGAGATNQTIVDGMIELINNDTRLNLYYEAEAELDNLGVKTYANNRFYVRSKRGEVFSLTATTDNIDTIAPTAATDPMAVTYLDWVRGFEAAAFTLEAEPKGFLTAPQAQYNTTSVWERLQIRNAMASAAFDLRWFALLDPARPTITTNPLDAVVDYGSHVGFSAAYYPYLIDRDQDYVAPSVLVGAYALLGYASEGIQKPPAGTDFPFKGLSDVEFDLGAAERDYLAANRINPIRSLPEGIVPYDIKTRSLDPDYRFIHTVIIMHITEISVYASVRSSGILFDDIDNDFFNRLNNIIESPLIRLYDGGRGAYYGDRPEDAFAVDVSISQQSLEDIEQYGRIFAQIFVCPKGAARQLVLNFYRVGMGRMSETLQLAGVRA